MARLDRNAHSACRLRRQKGILFSGDGLVNQATILESSGSEMFDQNVLQAIKQKVFIPPPDRQDVSLVADLHNIAKLRSR